MQCIDENRRGWVISSPFSSRLLPLIYQTLQQNLRHNPDMWSGLPETIRRLQKHAENMRGNQVYPPMSVLAQEPPSLSLPSKSFTFSPFRESNSPADNPDTPPPIIATFLILLTTFSFLVCNGLIPLGDGWHAGHSLELYETQRGRSVTESSASGYWAAMLLRSIGFPAYQKDAQGNHPY